MSATSDTDSGTGSELTVFLAALGKAREARYIRDMDALVEKATSAVSSVASINGKAVGHVVVRGNWQLKEALETEYSSAGDPDVSYVGMDFRMLLDDEADTYDDGNKTVKGVKEPEDAPMAEHVAAVHDIDPSDFDIKDGEQRRELIGSDVLDRVEDEYEDKPGSRINRAKAKAYAKAAEYAYNDYHEDTPTADAAVFLNDGTDRGSAALETARGDNPWVKNPSECEGSVLDISVDKDEDHIIDWTRFMLARNDLDESDLTDDQVDRLQEDYDAETLEALGVSTDGSSGSLDPGEQDGAVSGSVDPSTDSAASDGALQPADD
jgi:hypothetical protein